MSTYKCNNVILQIHGYIVHNKIGTIQPETDDKLQYIKHQNKISSKIHSKRFKCWEEIICVPTSSWNMYEITVINS